MTDLNDVSTSTRKPSNWNSAWRSRQSRILPPSDRAHPLVRMIFELASAQNITGGILAASSGYNEKNLSYWRNGKNEPRLHAVVDCFNALGYDLVPVKRGEQ